MDSASILELLREEASTGRVPSGSDALAHLVHWLASHTEQLTEDDVRILFIVGLSLYNTELEKTWNVNADGADNASRVATRHRRQSGTKTDLHETIGDTVTSLSPDEARARAEAAINALVEMRRPESPDAQRDTKQRRRWSDSPQWALTFRG